MSRSKLILTLLGAVLCGAAIDFLANGVLKIVWISIYATVYLGIAASIYNFALAGRWRSVAWPITLAFLSGTILGHLALKGRSHLRVYSMSVVGGEPFALQSPEFSEQLLVSSDKLQKELSEHAPQKNIPVSIQVVDNYGCIESFKVSTVAGVDVMSDPDANWVWRAAPVTAPNAVAHAGMKEENQRLLWCRIQWY